MRPLRSALLALALAALPVGARAALLLESSVGVGWEVSPDDGRQHTNVMLAPGFLIGELLKLELGFVANLADVKGRDFDIGLRPMVVIDPPLFPLYGRAIFVVNNLSEGPVTYAYGAAVGVSMGIGPGGAFGEAGLLPRNAGGTGVWVLEGRTGIAVEL